MIDYLGLLNVERQSLLPRFDMRMLLKELDQTSYYVYALWRTDRPNPEPFYIGKGNRFRAIAHSYRSDKRNCIKQAIFNKTNVLYSIIEFNISESEATLLERHIIAKLGRICDQSGPLANLTPGGEGLSEHRKSGGSHGRARSVTAAGICYETITSAATALRVAPSAVHKRINNGWSGYFYNDVGQMPRMRPEKNSTEHLERMRQNFDNKSRRVIVNGITFRSMSAAAAHFSVTYRTICKRCRSLEFPEYSFIS